MAPIKRALCVGINYPGTSAALYGCVNDALDWASVLRDRGYDVTMLLDAGATRQAILDALADMVATVRYRGRGVFTYSGHGTWVPDRDGDEVDGRDEALVPADYRTGGLITDDDLHLIMQRRRFGARFLTISDSCHSGTLHRAAAPTEPAPTGETEFLPPRPRFLPPAQILEGRDLADAALVEDERPRGLSRSTGVLISGCDDPEFSWDASFNGRANGAFTRVALQTLGGLGPNPTYKQWHAAIRRRLPSPQFQQTPQVQGTRWQQSWRVFD